MAYVACVTLETRRAVCALEIGDFVSATALRAILLGRRIPQEPFGLKDNPVEQVGFLLEGNRRV